MVLVDSSTWINHFTGRDTDSRRMLILLLQKGLPIVVGDLILLEVLRGCRNEQEYQTLHQALSALPWVALLTPELAIVAAQYFRFLRSKGLTIRKPNDVIIATWCIQHDVALLHDDRDFEPFQQYLGLRVQSLQTL
jgi:predicted nucleic acid-binding protein